MNVSGLSSWNDATAFTVEAWIYTSVGNNDMKIVGKTNGLHSDGFAMDVQYNKLYLELWLGNATSPYSTKSTATFSNNKWTHIAMTWQSGGSMKGYINGVEVINVSTASYTLANEGTLKIGAAPWDVAQFPFNGRLDEVRVWDDVRTEAEIRQNMYREVPDPSSEANLKAYYKLNETSGTTATDSKNSYDGTLTNYGSQTGYWETSPAIFWSKECFVF